MSQIITTIEAYQAYKKGLPMADAAKALGITRSALCYRFIRAGLPANKRTGRPLGTSEQMPPIVKQWFADRQAGLTYQAIADKTGLTRQAIQGRLKYWESRYK